MKIMEIEWIDSASSPTVWSPKGERFKPAECKSIGYFVEKDKNGITFCQSDGGDQYGNLFVIPRKCILKTRIIRQ